MNRRFLPGALILCCLASGIRAEDWPQFRGPRRDGVSTEKGLLKAWPKEGPKLAWKFEKGGLGFSSIAVVGNAAYISGTRGDDEVVIAIDAATGSELWTAKIGPIFTFESNTWGDGPRGTPTVDGNYLYALGGQGELICVDRTTKGTEKWRKNLSDDLKGEMMTQWGYSESPLIDGDLLICTPGGKQGTFAALDKKTGQLKWRSKELTNSAPYSSVVAAEINGVRQYIGLSYIDGKKGGVVSGVAAKDGTLLWSASIFEGPSYAVSPTPIVKGNLVYVTSSGGCHLFEIDKDMKAKDLYGKRVQKTLKNRDGGVILIGDHIYGHSDPEMWMCQNFKTGKNEAPEGWFERNAMNCTSGSITAADGMLYLLTDKGEVALVEANPAKYVEISTFTLPQLSKYPATRLTSQSSKVWSHPAIANGRLYLRDCEYVYCYEIK